MDASFFPVAASTFSTIPGGNGLPTRNARRPRPPSRFRPRDRICGSRPFGLPDRSAPTRPVPPDRGPDAASVQHQSSTRDGAPTAMSGTAWPVGPSCIARGCGRAARPSTLSGSMCLRPARVDRSRRRPSHRSAICGLDPEGLEARGPGPSQDTRRPDRSARRRPRGGPTSSGFGGSAVSGDGNDDSRRPPRARPPGPIATSGLRRRDRDEASIAPSRSWATEGSSGGVPSSPSTDVTANRCCSWSIPEPMAPSVFELEPRPRSHLPRVAVTSTSLGPATDITLAQVTTAIPPSLPEIGSVSPKCTPARMTMPND